MRTVPMIVLNKEDGGEVYVNINSIDTIEPQYQFIAEKNETTFHCSIVRVNESRMFMVKEEPKKIIDMIRYGEFAK